MTGSNYLQSKNEVILTSAEYYLFWVTSRHLALNDLQRSRRPIPSLLLLAGT